MKFRMQGFAALLIAGLFMFSKGCLKDDFESLLGEDSVGQFTENAYAEFDFETTGTYEVLIQTLYNDAEAIDGVYVEVYSENPYNINGEFKGKTGEHLVHRGVTNNEGQLLFHVSVSSFTEKLYLVPSFPGYERSIEIPLTEECVDLTLQVFI